MNTTSLKLTEPPPYKRKFCFLRRNRFQYKYCCYFGLSAILLLVAGATLFCICSPQRNEEAKLARAILTPRPTNQLHTFTSSNSITTASQTTSMFLFSTSSSKHSYQPTETISSVAHHQIFPTITSSIIDDAVTNTHTPTSTLTTGSTSFPPSVTTSTPVTEKDKSNSLAAISPCTPPPSDSNSSHFRLAAGAALFVGGAAVAGYTAYNLQTRNSIQREKIRTDAINEKLSYQSTQHAREQISWERQSLRSYTDIERERQCKSDLGQNLIDTNRNLLCLQTTLRDLRAEHSEKIDELHKVNLAVMRLMTSIASIEPRLRQDNEKLRVSCTILAKTRDTHDIKSAARCNINTQRSYEMKKMVLLCILWNQHALKLHVPAKWKTMVKDIAISYAISSAIDAFCAGKYIIDMTKKLDAWGLNLNAYQYPIGSFQIPSSEAPRLVRQSVIHNGKQISSDLVKITTKVYVHQSRRESILQPLFNFGKYVLGSAMTTSQKIDHSFVRRNILLKELQSGWEKEEIMNFTLDIDHTDVSEWAAEKGLSELYQECLEIIASEMK